jgi:cobalt/nickel transport system permease protein
MSGLSSSTSSLTKLDELSQGNSFVHRLHPTVKIAMSFVFVIIVLSYDNLSIVGLCLNLVILCLLTISSSIPLRFLVSRVMIALPFSLAAIVTNLILMTETAFVVHGIAVSFGVLSAITILLKTFLCVWIVLILIATTPFTAVINRLISFGIPKIFCLVLSLIYRYLTVLLGEAFRSYSAYQIRSHETKGVAFKHMGPMLGNLILRSFDRSERLYEAMKLRGFDGTFKVGINPKPEVFDILFGVMFTLLCLSVRFLSYIQGGLF